MSLVELTFCIPYATSKSGYYNVPHFVRGLCFHLGVGYPF